MTLFSFLNWVDSHNTKAFLALTFFGIFMFSFGVSTLPLLIEGVQRSADSEHFLFYVDQILEQETLRDVLATIFLQGWARFYSTWLLLLSGTVGYYGDSWPQAIATLNIFFHTITITLSSAFTYLITRKLSLTIFIAGLLSLSVDILIRVHWPISDSWFFFTSTLAFVLIALVCYQPRNKFLVVLAVIAILVAGLTRPHGLGIFIVGIAALLWRKQFSQLSSKTCFVLVILVSALLIVSFIMEAMVFGPNYQPITQEDSMLHGNLSKGMVLEGVYNTYHDETEYFGVRMHVIFDRFITFFSFFPPNSSTRHIFLSSIFFVPWYIAFARCWIIVRSNELDPRLRCLILLSTIWILSVAAYAGWAHVTYEYRYRLPLMPIFAFQTMLGIYLSLPTASTSKKSR